MVAGFWFLILLLLPGAFAEVEAGQAENQCLKCHPAHYAELSSCTGCHRGVPLTQRLDIAHSGLLNARFSAFTLEGSLVLKRGEQRLKDYACRRCHTSAGKGNLLAANLDLSQQDSTPEELALAIQEPVLFMPEFHFTETQRVEVVNALLAGGRRAEIPQGELPAVIHFEGETAFRELLFEKHCGGCHRVLTTRHGGLGSGLIGPNLSGLFSEFYLPNFGVENQLWTVENLEKWLKNPRKIRPLSQMSPVSLEKADFEKLTHELQTTDKLSKQTTAPVGP